MITRVATLPLELQFSANIPSEFISTNKAVCSVNRIQGRVIFSLSLLILAYVPDRSSTRPHLHTFHQVFLFVTGQNRLLECISIDLNISTNCDRYIMRPHAYASSILSQGRFMLGVGPAGWRSLFFSWKVHGAYIRRCQKFSNHYIEYNLWGQKPGSQYSPSFDASVVLPMINRLNNLYAQDTYIRTKNLNWFLCIVVPQEDTAWSGL